MANEGGSIDDDAEADESAGHGVIGVIGVGSDVEDADAAAGNGVFGGGANVGVVGKKTSATLALLLTVSLLVALGQSARGSSFAVESRSSLQRPRGRNLPATHLV